MTRAGTGKTYASAFALRDLSPKRALFLVHREQISKQALKSYRRVFEDGKVFGLLSGTSKDYEAEYLFATIQSMSKRENLERFAKDAFDVIVIDEVHRVGAGSYQKVMEYFEPELWLGMTASPERTDGFDIYALFDHNIAYEIRLQQALEENLLCPFHYFGVTDLEINGEVFDDNTGLKNFKFLVSDSRVEYVIEKAKYYGFSGERVKGLIFCSRKEEARELSKKFNERGYATIALCGEDDQRTREESIERLTSDERVDKLDYIFTVDIFNEGVDIPEINQVIMLRPTQSPIVFVQQLGRGLRKAEGKEYVVVLDFIGNYTNNFMIPIALSGDRTYNKDNMRRYVSNGNRVIPGSSTVHFDEISKERIYKSIDQIKGIKGVIKESYRNLKYQLGRVPNLVDFYECGEVDPLLILSNFKTYYAFLKVVEQEYALVNLSEEEVTILEYLSKIIPQGKRPHDWMVLKDIILNGKTDKESVSNQLAMDYYYIAKDLFSIDAAIDVMQGTFVSNNDELEKNKCVEILQKTNAGFYERMSVFSERLAKREFNARVSELVQLGIRRYQDIYSKPDRKRGAFVLYEKYSRRDVCLLLNWGRDLSSTMYGMKRIGDDVAIFVTYNKGEAGEEKQYLEGKPDYADEFIDNQTFLWDSQIGKGPESSYMKDVQEATSIYL